MMWRTSWARKGRDQSRRVTWTTHDTLVFMNRRDSKLKLSCRVTRVCGAREGDDQTPFLWRNPIRDIEESKYYPWFKDCIRVIDGTHIPTVAPTDKAVPYRSRRKNESRQNVMVVCYFNMRFTWIWPGWEGSAHDFRIFTEATTRTNTNFPHSSQGQHCPYIIHQPDRCHCRNLAIVFSGKCYLVDVGYRNTRGYLAPYRGCRYHLQEN